MNKLLPFTLSVFALITLATEAQAGRFAVSQEKQEAIATSCNNEFSDGISQKICLKKEVKAIKKLHRYAKQINYLDDLSDEEIATNELWSVFRACELWTADEASYEIAFRTKRCIAVRNKSANLAIATPRRLTKRLRKN